MLISSQSMREKDPKIKTKKLVIHKNVIFEKFREKRIERENCDLVKRLVRTSCEIIKNKSS